MKRGSRLGGVQHTQATAGSRSDVEQPSALPDPADNLVHRWSDLGNLGGYRKSHLLVFLVDDFEYLGSRPGVDSLRGWVNLLCQKTPEVHEEILINGAVEKKRRRKGFPPSDALQP